MASVTKVSVRVLESLDEAIVASGSSAADAIYFHSQPEVLLCSHIRVNDCEPENSSSSFQSSNEYNFRKSSSFRLAPIQDSNMANSLVRDVVERRHDSLSPSARQPFEGGSGGSSETGFPAVQHRSQPTSAFKRARQDERVQSGLSASKKRLDATPNLRSLSEWSEAGVKSKAAEDSMGDISRLNEEAVNRMRADERTREREDILDRFGTGIDDLMAKVREARERRAAREALPKPHDIAHNKTDSPVSSPPVSVPPSPRTRAARKIRFAEPTEADVHVYESQPSSPKRTLALLPPPPENLLDHNDISSLGPFNGSIKPQEASGDAFVSPPTVSEGAVEPPEEGTPEDIRRRFFPSEMPPASNPTLAWMLPSPTSRPKLSSLSDSNFMSARNSVVGSTLEPRYSLSGRRLSSSQITSLPTHLGLHHHSSTTADVPAGYTLSDLLLLSRSSVPAQRATILGVLANILRTTREQIYASGRRSASGSFYLAPEEPQTSSGPGCDVDLDAMRRDALDAAVDALGTKGGVGQRAVDLLWEVVVGISQADLGLTELDDLTRVDLTPDVSARLHSAPPSSKSKLKTPSDSRSSHSSVSTLVSLPLAPLIPALKYHIIASPSPSSRTHAQVLDVLLVLSYFAHHARTIASHDGGTDMIAAMMGPHLQPSFGSDADGNEEVHATPTSIRILQVLARCDRDIATRLTGPADVLLRYITMPLTPMQPGQPLLDSYRRQLALLEEALRFYAILSQYGLYTQVATTAQDHFTRIGAWLFDTRRAVVDPALDSLSCTYLTLLESFIVCATDPHRTTPTHDILWSQVQGWSWGEWTMDFVESLASPPVHLASSEVGIWAADVDPNLWTSVCHTAAAYVEGASVNGVKSGVTESANTRVRLGPLFGSEGGMWRAVHSAVETLWVWNLPHQDIHSRVLGAMRRMAEAAGLVAAILRLSLACSKSDEGPLFELPEDNIREVCVRFIGDGSGNGPFDLVFGTSLVGECPLYAHAFLRPLSSLLVRQLQSSRWALIPMDGTQGDVDWIRQASCVLRVLLPGDEDYAKWIIETTCESISPSLVQKVLSSAQAPREFWNKDGMKVLLPFLTHSFQPIAAGGNDLETSRSQAAFTAPLSPTPASISQCTTLNLPSLSRIRDDLATHDKGLVLPLKSDWPTLSLNHLLRSGSSLVFHALPLSWDATETDVVRASLLLMRIVQEVTGKCDATTGRRMGMSRPEVVLACMKVFMLEHGQQQVDSGDEVFRDSWVTQWMEELLKPFTFASASSHASPPYNMEDAFPPLERVFKYFLGTGTPFYQFYTDFLALYDAVSFSHSLFGRLLLPPVSMRYPLDYRKLLFGDFSHILRTVKTTVQDVICDDVREYLWPVEHDPHMIGWYLKALMKSDVQGFLRWVALHHVAANIWPEFRGGEDGSSERAGKLLSAVVQQGSEPFVREVALYRQSRDEAWIPPKCFMPGEEAWRERRWKWTERFGDDQTKTRLQSLFSD